MSDIKLLLCDKDVCYTQALVGYLISSRIGENLSVTTYHDMEGLTKEEGFFNVGILGKDFLSTDVKYHLQRKIILSEERCDEEKSEYLFKYQNMDSFMGKVFKTSSVIRGGQELVVVYSPVFHELRLPFTLCLCKMFSEAGEILFIDMEQISILNHLMGKEPKRDLLDYLYVMESKRGCNDLNEFLDYCENFAFLPPMSSPVELPEITKKQWDSFFENIKKSGFKKTVVLIDGMIQGMTELLEKCDEIIVLGKPGKLNYEGMGIFNRYMEKYGFLKKTKQILVPLSSGESSDIGYTSESIFQGNMMRFVREEMSSVNGKRNRY